MMTDRELMQQAVEAMEYADACLKKQLTAKTKHEYAQDLLMTAGTALRERLAQPEQEPVACQYAKDVAMPEHRCAAKCQYAQPEQEQWDAIPDAFNEWWNADYDDTGNPYRKDSPAYWAWSGWKAASKQPEQAYWNAVEGWVKIDEVREHFDSVGCGVIYKTAGEDRTPLYTTPPQRKPLPPQSPCEMTQAEGKMFKLGWLECEAAHGIKGEA